MGWNIAPHTWPRILKPGAADINILFNNGKLEAGDLDGEENASSDSRNPCANNCNLHNKSHLALKLRRDVWTDFEACYIIYRMFSEIK